MNTNCNLRRLAAVLCLALAAPAWPSDWTPLQFRVEGPSWVYPTRGESHTATMLQRTADAVGAIEQTYDYGDTLLFCSADLTHKLTAANPHHMPLCPYSISVYSLAGESGIVYLAIRAPEKNVPAYDAIHELLEGIIYDTVNW